MSTTYPLPLLPEVRAALAEMLDELESHQLEVCLVPQRIRTNEGGMIRVAVNRNAPWYRAYCAAHLSTRRRRNAAPDTKIKRRDTLATLRALLRGSARSTYAAWLVGIARQRIRSAEAAQARAVAR